MSITFFKPEVQDNLQSFALQIISKGILLGEKKPTGRYPIFYKDNTIIRLTIIFSPEIQDNRF